MADEQTYRLRVRWLGPQPAARPDAALRLTDHGATNTDAGSTEFGMQRGRWELIPGVADGDSLVFETEVTPHRDKAGRQRYRGPDVQGTPEEPFLYLSWRVQGEQAWIMRAKVLLAPLTEEFLRELPEGVLLETTVSRLGGRERGFVQEWRVVGVTLYGAIHRAHDDLCNIDHPSLYRPRWRDESRRHKDRFECF